MKTPVTIAIVFFGGLLEVMTVHGGNPKTKAELSSPNPSPQDQEALQKNGPELKNYRIACQSNRDGQWEIYVMNGDGSGQKRLTEDGGFFAKWSPDGRKIAYNHGEDIYLMNADGSEKKKLVSKAYESFWSPDGKELGYSKGKPNAQGALAILNLDTQEERIIRGNKFLQKSGGGAWSPDGKRIAFFSNVLGWLVMMMNADGSHAMPVLGKDENCRPDWSPDGSRLVFVWAKGPGSFIQTIAPDGTGLQPLTPARDYELWEYYPDWSPDGKWVAYAIGAENDAGGIWQIYVIRSGGGEPIRLTFQGGNSEPDWCPITLAP
jgi:TolB protein